MIGQDYIAELNRRTDITELVGSYVELKRAGRMEKGLCPFHNEKTPSFYVYPETASFYCFGCGVGGDAITFIKKIQNSSYVEAIKFLAARTGMPMPEEDDDTAKIRSRLLAANREAARFFVDCLNAEQGRHARGYLRARGLQDNVIRRFGLGYAPDEFGVLRDHLKSLGFSEQEMTEAGVCKKSNKGGVYDAFRGRLMFPILDLRGNVIAFGGRQLGERGPKYLNSSDSMVFKKSRNLFALGAARKSGDRRFILAEGYMDVISLHQAGFSTAVATLGTALTAEQAKMISDYADQVVICYDGDEAGQKATARAINILKTTALKVGVLNLPNAKDPDEFIQKYGSQRFAQMLDGSGNTIEYALGKVKQEHDLTVPDGRAAYIRAALEVLAAEARPAERDIYAGRIAEETDVSKTSVLAQMDGVITQRNRRLARERDRRIKQESVAKSINIPFTATGSKALGVAFAEQQLVAALIKNPEGYLPLAKQRLRPEQFITPEMGQAYSLLLEKEKQDAELGLSALTGELPESTIGLLGRVLAMNYDIGFTQADVMMFIQRIEAGTAGPDRAAEMSSSELEQHIAALREKKQ